MPIQYIHATAKCIFRYLGTSSAQMEEVQQVNQQLAEKLGQLQADLEEVSHKYQAQVADNSQLSK